MTIREAKKAGCARRSGASGFVVMGAWAWLAGLLLGGGMSLPTHAAVVLELPTEGANPLTVEELEVTQDGLRLHVQERQLGEVLKGIQARSGIRIEMVSELLSKPITVSVDAPDWEAMLEKLLAGFNWLELSNDQRRIRQVIVVGERGEAALPQTTGPNDPSIGASPFQERGLRGKAPPDVYRSGGARRHERVPVPAERFGGSGAPAGASGVRPFYPGPPSGDIGAGQGPVASGSAGDGPPSGLGSSGDFPPPDSETLPYEAGPQESGPGGDGPPE